MDDRLAKHLYENNILDQQKKSQADISLLQKLSVKAIYDWVVGLFLQNTTRFSLPFTSYAILASPISTTPSFPFAATLPSFTIYPKQWSQGVFIGATNTGSHYWKIELLYNLAGVVTVAATITTASASANTTVVLTTTSFDRSDYSQSHIRFALRFTKVGSPSDISAHGPNVEYTLS